jgi:hypothetical protein
MRIVYKKGEETGQTWHRCGVRDEKNGENKNIVGKMKVNKEDLRSSMGYGSRKK